MPNRVARALKTRARGFLACLAKPPALQMKNIVSQEFKGTERLDLAMTKPEDSPSCTVPIRASNSWPTSSVAHMPCSIPRAVESLKKETEFRVNLDHIRKQCLELLEAQRAQKAPRGSGSYEGF